MKFPLPIISIDGNLSTNAKNTLLTVKINRHLRYPEAVLAQEIFESRRKLAIFAGSVGVSILVGGVASVLLAPWAGVVAVNLGMVLPTIYMRTPYFNRNLELQGHEVEVQAADVYYGVDQEQYRQSEAYDMKSFKPYGFSNWSLAKIANGMKKYSRRARKWVVEWDDEISEIWTDLLRKDTQLPK